MSDQVKNMEKAFKDRCVMMEEQSIKEMKQQKELWSTTEKVKREKWITEKTKIIKDQTIKGLEPEIQRMLAQHKIQLRQVEERLREEASKERQVAAEQTQQQLVILINTSPIFVIE